MTLDASRDEKQPPSCTDETGASVVMDDDCGGRGTWGIEAEWKGKGRSC